MRFGHFDDQRREYVITTPDTPEPWINYLGCEQFFSLISHLGGGYCFYKDARLRLLLRYRYNSAPADGGRRYFYLCHKAEYRERRNQFAFYHVNAPIVGFDTDREVFLGRYRGPGDPQAVLAGASLNSVASGGAPIASHSLQVDLAPGEEKIFIFVLGYVENPDDG